MENANQGKPKSRLLTRIHVHTLAYQAILIADTSQWPNSDVAVAKASLTAFRHVCASTKVFPTEQFVIIKYIFLHVVKENK